MSYSSWVRPLCEAILRDTQCVPPLTHQLSDLVDIYGDFRLDRLPTVSNILDKGMRRCRPPTPMARILR
jgi:hypothetical protein